MGVSFDLAIFGSEVFADLFIEDDGEKKTITLEEGQYD